MGLRIAFDRWLAKNAAGHTQLGDGGRLVIPADGLQIGSDVRLYRGAAGELMFCDTLVPFDVKLDKIILRQLIEPRWSCDFLGSSVEAPFNAVAIGSGTIGGIAADKEHPGVVAIQASAGANSGHSVKTSTPGSLSPGFLIGGGEKTVHVAKHIGDANTIARFGFLDSYSVASPVDGVYFYAAGPVVDGRTMSNTAGSVTGTTYTLTAGLWYRFESELNISGTVVTYRIYLCSTGALVWSDSLATNIPTGAGRQCGNAFNAFNTAGGVADLWHLDLIEITIKRMPVR